MDGAACIVRWNGETQQLNFVRRNIRADEFFTTLTGESSDGRGVMVLDVKSGQQWRLGPDDRASYGATLSDDGSQILYVTEIGGTPQLMLSRRDGTDWKQLTKEEQGIAEGVLSGDGRVAWASTRDDRLFRIRTDTGDVTEVLSPPVVRADSAWSLRPGSMVRLRGVRLSPDVRVEDTPLYVVSATESEIIAQVPWEAKEPDPPRGRRANGCGRRTVPQFALV